MIRIAVSKKSLMMTSLMQWNLIHTSHSISLAIRKVIFAFGNSTN